MDALSRQEYPAMLERLQPAAAVSKLNERVKRIGKVNSEMADWLQERRKVEDAYVAGLKKLARKPLQEVGGELGVFDAPWRKVVAAVEEIARSHALLSDRIDKDVEQPLRAFATTNREMQAMSTIQGNLAAMAKEVEDAQHNSEKINKKGGKASTQKVENALAKLQTANQQWEAQAPFVFESLQSLDERRLNHLRDVLTQLETHEADKVESNRIAVEQTLTALLEVDTSQEIKNWSQSVTAGKPVLERSARQLSNAGTVTNSVNTDAAVHTRPPATPRSTTDNRSEHSAKQESIGGESKLKSRFGTMLGRRRQSINSGFSREKSPSKGFKPMSFPNRNTASREGRPSPSPRASSTNLRDSPSRDNRLSSLAESPPALSPVAQTNGHSNGPQSVTKGDDIASGGPSNARNGPEVASFPDLSDVQPPPGPPPSHLKAINETQTDSEGFTVPAAANDPISQAENEASQDNDLPQFKLDIRKDPIQEQDADAQAALSNVANTLRSSQLATPGRKVGTVRGRRDVRNTIYVPTPEPLHDTLGSENNIPPSPGINTGRAAALAALSSGDHAPPTASDTTSIRSGHSLTNNLSAKHAEMPQPGLNASVIETVSATFEEGVAKSVKISGEVALIHNRTADDFSSPSNDQKIRINNFPNLEAIGPNRTFIHPVSVEKPDEFTVDLEHVASKPVVAFTYRVHIDESNMTRCGPLLVKPAWKSQGDKLSLIINYGLNPSGGYESVTFNNLVLVAAYQGGKASGCQTKPTGTHLKEKSLVYWRLGDVTLTRELQKVICRFHGGEGIALESGHIEARWEINGSAIEPSVGSAISLSRLESSKGTEKEGSTDPFADDSIANYMTQPSPERWLELEMNRKFASRNFVFSTLLDLFLRRRLPAQTAIVRGDNKSRVKLHYFERDRDSAQYCEALTKTGTILPFYVALLGPDNTNKAVNESLNMMSNDIPEQYITFEGRLASYQSPPQASKRRASNANSKQPKSLKWPHKFLSTKQLAAAGFFYNPRPANPDNVTCFLCQKSLDGWEVDDDPLVEHLKHSQDCGWAVVATIETQDGVLSEELPSTSRMLESRKATFGNHWPHESKKGWKCKVKQMVEAGWKYTPTPESDDMATCAYCSLALDGWEPGDKPMEEHFSRSPDCNFFSLINDNKQNAKKSKSQRDRTSKASRLSIQSAVTAASESQSILDMPAEDDESILTTATTATQTGKRCTKGKKATTTKPKKTRAKKAEHVEVGAAPEPEDADFEVKIDSAPKSIGSKKRKSEQETEPMADVPSPKRRATRSRGSIAVNDSIANEILPDTHKTKSRKGRSSARPTREVSMTPTVQGQESIPADDEIDMALEADLKKNFSDDEETLALPNRKTRNKRGAKAGNDMFGAEEVVIDDAVIEAELEAMELDSTSLPKAKGAKGKQSRKPSAKQVTRKETAERKYAERTAKQDVPLPTASELERSIHKSSPIVQSLEDNARSRRTSRPPPGEVIRGSRASVLAAKKQKAEIAAAIPANDHEQEDDSGNDTDQSMASQSTVVRGGVPKRGKNLKKPSGTKTANEGVDNIVSSETEPAPRLRAARTSQNSNDEVDLEEVSVEDRDISVEIRGSGDDVREGKTTVPEAADPIRISTKPTSRPQIQQTLTAMMEHREDSDMIEKNSRTAGLSPKAPPSMSATPPPRLSFPSESPQSSDAENHPPSSRPSSNTKPELHYSAVTTKPATPTSTFTRVPLANTPLASPSKRNVIAGLKSSQPWTAVDLDTVFLRSPGGDENMVEMFGKTSAAARKEKLTSPELKMSVEEWILFNASRAEEKLRSECEGMVSIFEREGGRAMRALEEVECIE